MSSNNQDNYALFMIDQSKTTGIARILMRTKYFAKSKNYEELLSHIINIVSLALIQSQSNGIDAYELKVDMSSTLYKNVDIGFFKNVVKLMLDLFPNKLLKCEIYNAPGYFPTVFSLIKPLIPRATRDKIFIVDGGHLVDVESVTVASSTTANGCAEDE